MNQELRMPAGMQWCFRGNCRRCWRTSAQSMWRRSISESLHSKFIAANWLVAEPVLAGTNPPVRRKRGLGGLRRNGFLNPDAAQRHYFCHPTTDENSNVLSYQNSFILLAR